jgi:hypothetical protein
MATTNNLVMPYYVKKVINPTSRVNNRYFAHVRRQGTLSTRGLADHMLSHGFIANKGELIKTLSMLSECIPELVAQGYGVKLDGLGIFYPSILNKKGGSASAEEFNAAQHIKGVRFRFTPDSSDLDNLTSKAYGKEVSLEGGWEKDTDGNMIKIKKTDDPEP